MEVAYLTLFSIAFLAATILPFSSEVVLAGLSATSGEKLSLLVVASFGNVLGSSFNWVLGKYTRNLETKYIMTISNRVIKPQKSNLDLYNFMT